MLRPCPSPCFFHWTPSLAWSSYTLLLPWVAVSIIFSSRALLASLSILLCSLAASFSVLYLVQALAVTSIILSNFFSLVLLWWAPISVLLLCVGQFSFDLVLDFYVVCRSMARVRFRICGIFRFTIVVKEVVWILLGVWSKTLSSGNVVMGCCKCSSPCWSNVHVAGCLLSVLKGCVLYKSEKCWGFRIASRFVGFQSFVLPRLLVIAVE